MGMSAGSNRKSRTVLSEINVTPLVDVMLVLLIIFMITAPMMQQGLEVELPETSNSGVSTTDEPFIIVINKDRSISFGDSKIPLKEVQKKLKAIFETRKNKQVYIQADKNVDYGTVAQTMGEVRSAGIYQVGLITLPKMGL
ncbi:MAG TPA: protein TolR [Bdellovibrionales bacterium]|nr:protein TolR [Pseudobdellovibrionaceae bacterium]HAG90493.1 protein TolR [Bdellovibrionales bacterium]|tara:strand:- start:1939 stop:2361 length:423 start_codon:yes stop_codon:yes gene_type:complete